MNKTWIGYASSLLLFIAGIFMAIGGKPTIGVVFMLLSIVSVVLKIILNRINNIRIQLIKLFRFKLIVLI